MDSTLVDTFTLIVASYSHAVAACFPKGLNADAIINLPNYTLDEALARTVPADQVALASSRYHEYFMRHFDRRTRTYPGIRKLLASLQRAGVTLAVFTGASRKSAEIALHRSGLAPFFDAIVTADDVSQTKPDPQGLELVMDAVGAPKGKTVYVGDDPNDIVASRRAGIQGAAALWGSRKRDQLRALRPDLLFNDPFDADQQLAKAANADTRGLTCVALS